MRDPRRTVRDEHGEEVTMVWHGKTWRRLFSASDTCPYVHCRAPSEHLGRIADRGLAVDLYRCTGPKEHRWAEPIEGLAE